MLIFDEGLKIRFWDYRSQRIEGVIRRKSRVDENAYMVNHFEFGKVTEKRELIYDNQITDILVKNRSGCNVWLKIEDVYKIFPSGATIRPDERYNLSEPPKVRYQQLSTNALRYGIHDEEAVKSTIRVWRIIPKKVIFNGPATVVMWSDGTKTVVKKTDGDTDDREKAVMYAIFKKMFGNRADVRRFLKLFKEVESNEEKKEEAGSSELCQCESGAGEGSSESTV